MKFMVFMGQFSKIWDIMGHFSEIWDSWDEWEDCDYLTLKSLQLINTFWTLTALLLLPMPT